MIQIWPYPDPVSQHWLSWFLFYIQALNQLLEISSTALNVSVASGGDPHYPLNIKMAGGEEVHGNSGSFRHFLSAIVEQLHGPTLNLLVPYRGPGNFTGTSSTSVAHLGPGYHRRSQNLEPRFNKKCCDLDPLGSASFWEAGSGSRSATNLGGHFGALKGPNLEKVSV